MKNILIFFLIFFSYSLSVFAKTIEQKKSEIKKVYEAGGMSKVEFNKAIELLESPDNEEKKQKTQSFSLNKKKKDNKQELKKLLDLILQRDKEKEKISLKKIDELGEPVRLDNSYFPENMIKKFRGCNNSFKCKGDKAGKQIYYVFNKRGKAYQQKNPGEMIKAMAMFEVFYSSKLWYARDSLTRYRENKYDKLNTIFKEKDEKEIRSLFGINKGRISMREALGMSSETTSKEAIEKFWLLGEFLSLGTGVQNKKLPSDLKKRQALLQTYKSNVSKLRKKLEEDIEGDQDE